ncbi:nucleic acid-binding OB-fold [Fusarium mundagurra]|uniref:Nucleic acid-binding OB-fold n=1 Tax=Fusarium mundagurra TaxID=1567541 RepID=A0A8H6DLC7_9HYPO|nr:nucleic acid-binding OB-fold [Fusarium mundagurra]
MAPQLLLFAGAPPPSSLTTQSCTITQIDDSFAEFLGLAPQGTAPVSSPSIAPWRSLPLNRKPLHTGFSQTHNISINLANQSEFFTTAEISFKEQSQSFEGEDPENVLSQFYDHSLALHNSIPSSQLDSFEETTFEETSFMTTSSTANLDMRDTVPSHLSDLEDIPPARRILALNPQTVTLNIIAGIISIAQPRTVTTRWGRSLSLVEILLGDDTKTGFAVTFWLAEENNATAEISALRRQDVVLMQNVALHVFKDKVYGQSLRRGMSKVSLLWRRDGSGLYSTRELSKRGQMHPQLQKAKQVKDWVLKFVGADVGVKTRARKTQISWDRPPDDTQ